LVEGIAKKFGDEKFIVSQILNPFQEVSISWVLWFQSNFS